MQIKKLKENDKGRRVSVLDYIYGNIVSWNKSFIYIDINNDIIPFKQNQIRFMRKNEQNTKIKL